MSIGTKVYNPYSTGYEDLMYFHSNRGSNDDVPVEERDILGYYVDSNGVRIGAVRIKELPPPHGENNTIMEVKELDTNTLETFVGYNFEYSRCELRMCYPMVPSITTLFTAVELATALLGIGEHAGKYGWRLGERSNPALPIFRLIADGHAQYCGAIDVMVPNFGGTLGTVPRGGVGLKEEAVTGQEHRRSDNAASQSYLNPVELAALAKATTIDRVLDIVTRASKRHATEKPNHKS